MSATIFLKNANLVKPCIMKIRRKTEEVIQIHQASLSTKKGRLFKPFKEAIIGRTTTVKVTNMPQAASTKIP